MNLHHGCGYCNNLECVNQLENDYKCLANKNIVIKNAGACFIAIADNDIELIIENCPGWKPIEKT